MEKKFYQAPEIKEIELENEMLIATSPSDEAPTEQGPGVNGEPGGDEGMSSRSRLGGWDD